MSLNIKPDFQSMDSTALREYAREVRAEYRSEKSRRHMAWPETLRGLTATHREIMDILRGRGA